MTRLAGQGAQPGTVAKHRIPSRAGGGAWLVKASQESLGGTGSCGHPIQASGYSELSTIPRGTASDFKALGNLPCGTVLEITNPANGKTVRAAKQDVGAGSPGFLPVMGLYPATVSALGLTGGEYNVIIQRADGGSLHPVRGTPAGAGNYTDTGTTGAATPSSTSGGGPSLLSVLGDLVTGNIGDLASALAMAAAAGVKDMAVGVWDMIIAPAWHRNQLAVWWYTNNIVFPTKYSTAGYKAWQTWPVNAAFWGFGYALLFTDPASGNLRPVPVRQSRLARHARKAQALPARHSLIKPKRVKEKTPVKPHEKTSRVRVRHSNTLTAHRKRPVRVSGRTTTQVREVVTNGQRNGPDRERARTTPAPVISQVKVDREEVIRPSEKVKRAADAITHSHDSSGQRTPTGSRGHSPGRPEEGGRSRHETRHRGDTDRRSGHRG